MRSPIARAQLWLPLILDIRLFSEKKSEGISSPIFNWVEQLAVSAVLQGRVQRRPDVMEV